MRCSNHAIMLKKSETHEVPSKFLLNTILSHVMSYQYWRTECFYYYVFIIWDCVLLSSIKIHSLKWNNKHLLILILALLMNKNFVWAGQLIVTMLIQAVKLPSVAVTRLPLLFGLFTLVRVYLHYRFRRLLVKRFKRTIFLRFT